MSNKIPADFAGSVHVRTNEGFKVLAAGDEIPEGVEISPEVLNRGSAKEAARVAPAADARPVEDVLAEANKTPAARTRGKRA